MSTNIKEFKICVIGLGYVGLPLIVEINKKYKSIGFDIDEERIKELRAGYDRTNELTKDIIDANKLSLTSSKTEIKDCNIYIVTVPTPVDKNKKPNLVPLISASTLVGGLIEKGNVVIYESTVFPGCTEDVCVPVLEAESKLTFNKDFFCGYSPERINPGDKKHKLKDITKIVAFKNNKRISIIKKVYKELGKNIVYTSKIKESETAKVVENIQRDINIAFINEIFMFCKKSRIDFKEVINLAKTKWNFMDFNPGLVGGHCLPVDPYYFAEVAKKYGQNVKVTLAGRSINNGMVSFITKLILKDINKIKNKKPKILISGLTYKPNVPDTRNSLAIEIFNNIKQKHFTQGYDPIVNKNDRKRLKLIDKIKISKYDKVYVLTEHNIFKKREYLNKDKISFVFKDL